MQSLSKNTLPLIDRLGDRLAVFTTLALVISTVATVGLGLTILG